MFQTNVNGKWDKYKVYMYIWGRQILNRMHFVEWADCVQYFGNY